jgi:hypothetical protein
MIQSKIKIFNKNKNKTNKKLRFIMKKAEKESLQLVSKHLAKFVRDNIEDLHAEFIPDAAMPQFNKCVRDAIYTGLVIISKSNQGDKWCKEMIDFNFIPLYWEKPELIKGMSKYSKPKIKTKK